MKDVRCTILGSGSCGNSILVHSADSGILVDAGLSKKQIITRLKADGIDPEIIKAVVITHDNNEHCKGARIIADSLSVPTYIPGDIFTDLSDRHLLGKRVTLFEPDSTFDINEFTLQPFSIPHTSLESVGLTISHEETRIGIMMSLGSVPDHAREFLSGCNALILESDYDKEMLERSHRPVHLIRKVSGRFGHLSNHDCIRSLSNLITPETHLLFLVHLSRDCNNAALLNQLAYNKLQQMNRTDIQLWVVPYNNFTCPVEVH